MIRQRVEGDSSGLEPLIPGLPDDVATLCLVRVHINAHARCKKVSKSWNSIFKSKRRFSRLRREFGLQDPWLYIIGFDHHTYMIHIKVLNLTTLSWHTVHVAPNLYYGGGSITSVSIPREGVLFVFGGVACRGSTVNVFLKYEACQNRWTVIKAMIGKLGLVTVGVVDGKVYVTGLDKNLSDAEHGPFEVFDPMEETWEPVPSYMRTQYDPNRATVFNGKLLLSYYDDLGRIYDPRTGGWENMAAQLKEGLRIGSTVQIHGHLFGLALINVKSGLYDAEREIRLRVYDAKSDRWDIVEGNALPQGVWWTSPVSSWDGKIYVVKDSVDVVIGNITNTTSSKSRFRVEWEMVVDAPRTFVNVSPLSAQVLMSEP